ncbi:uncharacterized protein B0H18DRAFT_238263 [Fomitopsis serialis]|uniref:uncharacterized protein n=1 Tax=Fomitopsis serialis TaxID=139415 RepID=UPI002008D0FF|nr:uncharacterized protein B0H18DRAFT_238263 [Neoantrodia serialis]KAH9912712.1 hypothetical protein B0H18DRAFT_238263 [Neoantrodia serialis]
MHARKTKRTAASDSVPVKGANGGTVRRRTHGGLKVMPTDILYEIMQRLHPRDLLRLSWSSKSFHAFLMKKSSAFIWKASLSSVQDLPPRPEHLIEPAWISLLFSSHCSVSDGFTSIIAS